MKILGKKIVSKDSSGHIRVSPETPEDVWHLFNLLSLTDVITMSTVRKVKTTGVTGSVKSDKVRCTLTIKVNSAPIYDSSNATIRISGVNSSESAHVRMGAAHTFTVGINETITITKPCWDAVHLQRIQLCTDVTKFAEVAGVVLQQTGLGHLCLITDCMTVTKAKIDVNIPKKRHNEGATGDKQAKMFDKFFGQMYRAIVEHVDFAVVKVVLIGGPGYIPADLLRFVLNEAARLGDKQITDNKDKFITVHASSGHKHALDEVLLDETVRQRLSDTKVSRDVLILDRFMRILDTDPDRAFYGLAHVQQAVDQGAVEHLLITDDVFRNSDVNVRRMYVALTETVKASSGSTVLFSGMHHAGRRLTQVSGVAAILRFPVVVHDDEGSSGEEDADWYFNGGNGNQLEEREKEKEREKLEKKAREAQMIAAVNAGRGGGK
jgi:protein pelota